MPNDTQMTIAFTSCMSTDVFAKSQPVWSRIAEEKPDLLILLGDSIYIDVSATPGGFSHPPAPDTASSVNDFAQHVLNLYQRQLAIPEFAALIGQTPTLAIWDDHDFLWNDADSRYRENPQYLGHMVVSSNLFQCWQQALNGQALPANTSDSRVWKRWSDVASNIQYDPAMPGYRVHNFLDGQVWVHLTDGRSWRRKDKKQLLGSDQRQRIENEITKNAPAGALHILASGSTFNKSEFLQESWQSYPEDCQWLLDLASQHNMLVLSGDLHKVMVPQPVPCVDKQLHEAVASGAAVNFAPWHVGEHDTVGQYTEKFGLLKIDAALDGQVGLQLFDHGQNLPALQRTWPRCF
jgi:alkaline phosphatase D